MQRPPNTEGQPQPDQRQIIDALNSILESDKFTAAPQMSAFLRYVVEQAASGNMTRIKAYTVAIDALGKPDSFDPQNDPVVRVLAGRLRAALASYYEANPATELRITMRPGSYVPSFIYRSSLSHSEKQPAISGANTDADSVKSAETLEPAQSTEHPKSQSAKASYSPQTNSGLALPTTSNTQNTGASVKTETSGNFGAYVHWMLRLPTVGIALAAVGVFVGMQLTGYRTPSKDASITTPVTGSISPPRSRPEKISLFVSAIDQGSSLNNQLNTIMSGIFSESESVRVYRILETATIQQHWPEDYLVSVDVLPLPDTTRISVQLVEAQTGRVSHSQHLALNKAADDRLSADDLDNISQFARDLVSEEGPLFEDYKIKQAAATAQ